MPIALTGPAQRALALGIDASVVSRRELVRSGVSRSVLAAHLAARRWRQIGSAIVMHNGPLTQREREHVALINCGPRSVLTSFTSCAQWGLTGWERSDIHVLAPAGTRRPRLNGIVLHWSVDWDSADVMAPRRLHRPAPSLVLAAGSFTAVRSACAILAAGVQQRLVTSGALHQALDRLPKIRHNKSLRAALYDIEQGAQALSEIDFRRLCRRHGLPMPRSQAVRIEPNGRRRYLDALWDRPSGGALAAEVDGAVHLRTPKWIDDLLRQNEVVLDGIPVLRYPSILVRADDPIVGDQLRRGLGLHQ